MALTPISLRLDDQNGRAAEEYRVRDGQIEFRSLRNDDDDCDWRSLSAADLSGHVMRNTVVAQWLKHRLGWRCLLQACVAEDTFYNGHTGGPPSRRRAA